MTKFIIFPEFFDYTSTLMSTWGCSDNRIIPVITGFLVRNQNENPVFLKFSNEHPTKVVTYYVEDPHDGLCLGSKGNL